MSSATIKQEYLMDAERKQNYPFGENESLAVTRIFISMAIFLRGDYAEFI